MNTSHRHLHASEEWVRCPRGPSGVELLEAAFHRHVFDRHMHDTYAIGVTKRGVQRFWCRSETHDSTPGNVIAINPGEVHDGRSGAAGGYAYRMFYVSVARFRNIVEDALQRPVARLDVRASLLVDPTLARHLNATWRAMTSSAGSLASEELLHKSLIHLATRHAHQPRVAQAAAHRDRLRRVRDYLHDRPGAVSVGELAAVASISRFQLTRQFQNEFGLPLHAYHMQVRLDEARRRLRLGMGIAEVAFALGFADQSHFHRRFKASFGVSPGAWQKAGSMIVGGRK
jgi:AraC-like DNA-binding protein